MTHDAMVSSIEQRFDATRVTIDAPAGRVRGDFDLVIAADDGRDLVEELWSAGRLVGAYPVKDRLGVIVGGPRADTRVGVERFAESAREALRFVGDRFDRVLTEIAGAEDTYYWSLTDCRAATWSTGRVVLLGDAASGFLPTAGIGAGMAIRSATVHGPASMCAAVMANLRRIAFALGT